MEAMTPRSWKRSKASGETTCACSMRKRKSRGECAVRHGFVVTMAAVGSLRYGVAPGRGSLARDAGLLGGVEGVEGHVVGAVADGVEAELEAGGGALGGHLVELVLVVARDAGVGGVVGVGRVHGGGAGAERAVHEALEHAECGAGDRCRSWLARRCLRAPTGRLKSIHS